MGVTVLVEVGSDAAMLEAVRLLRHDGLRDLETYAPYDVPEVDRLLRRPRPRLPVLVFLGGLAGAVLGYGIQWYADVFDYPLNVGGLPAHPVPAFIPATFEAAVLGASLVAFFGLGFILRLPALWHPVFEVDAFVRASSDRFWVSVRGSDEQLETRVRATLAPLKPIRLVRIPAES